eukprot:TRINITY_DN1323_c0_g2_i2.p1 TRINITY_DN1323_c0_g2~~TRINITY_DN1323_c0_g2_i2.p1  ORF type:complete len:179 (+),score=29.11 TRINITY_DN1323_c0_g2_i2:68-604(+)
MMLSTPVPCQRRPLPLLAAFGMLAAFAMLAAPLERCFVSPRARASLCGDSLPHSSAVSQVDVSRLPSPLRADPNQWGILKPLDKRKMPRKPPFIATSLLNKVTRMNKEGTKDTIQVFLRDSTIIPAMIGHTIALHNGRENIPLVINEGMVGFKLKDFVPTHTFKGHPKQAKVTKYRGR